MSFSVLVPLAQGAEEVEFVTLVDLFRRAGFTVVAAGLAGPGPVVCSRGVIITPDSALDQVIDENFDLLVLPGGQPGTNNLRDDRRVIELVRRADSEGWWLAAVCAAPLVLGAAGVLNGRRATSFPGTLENAEVAGLEHSSDPVVVDGRIVTARGPGAAMDFALVLIECLAGKDLRAQVENTLQRC